MQKTKLLFILTVFLLLAPMSALGGGLHSGGAVYVMSNSSDGNEVVVFQRDFDGRLTLAGAYATAGFGSGDQIDPLGSQGSLILSRNHRWLFAVNAGSDDISVFRVGRQSLVLTDRIYSGGQFPVSLTLFRNLLYVLNAGRNGAGAGIAGFRLGRDGELEQLSNATRALAPGGYHQVGFDPRGDALVVTQGDPNGENAILVFAVDDNGLPGAAPVVSPSVGVVPFGFIFDWRGHLLVAEAGSGALSSYEIQDDGTLEVISGSVANGNKATCWIAGTWFGGVFTANTGSDNISSYRANFGTGQVHLKDAAAASGNKPIDMAITADGRFLYVLNAADGTVGAFRISPYGGLKDLGTVSGLPPVFAQGIAVR
jgi:6-phosphogluconolactonase (cycloisomerase 2 family)